MGVVYLFKRDLRLHDNRGLVKAAEISKEILPIFIFDKEIIEKLRAEGQRLYYVFKAVKALSSKIKLYCFYDTSEGALRQVFKVYKPKFLITTASYSWSGRERNERIKKVCHEHGIEMIEVLENFLVNPEDVPERRVYTHFYKEWLKRLDLRETGSADFIVPNLSLPTLKDIEKQLPLKDYESFSPEDCQRRLKRFPFERYEELRNFPGVDGTSKLSPCIRFGILSLREIYKEAQGRSEQFIKELAWREFWYHIALRFSWVRDLEFQKKRRNIKWENREEYIRAFFEGKTGYPIVDAGVRQLLQEKWVHNRVRMVLASFLTKVLLVDWRIGERFFKEHLLDYDEVVNIGNWQWSASVGADPKPLRLFNPILQAKKFDPDCTYIKKYLPELAHLPCEMLHDPLSYRLPYIKPIVNYYERISMAKSAYSI